MKLAAVTGSSGMIGHRVIEQLGRKGCSIKALMRHDTVPAQGTEVVIGDLTSDEVLCKLLEGVDTVFHCAAELHDLSRMHMVNMIATERLAQMAADQGVACFIHISSAGVIGPTRDVLIDETTPCHPRNAYELSKLQAEQALSQLSGSNMRLCMLRPVNVIDDERPGVLAISLRNRWQDRLSLFIKGGESAHLVHAIDVAAAAVHLAVSPLQPKGIFFVGCDEDNRNTVSGVARMCRDACGASRTSAMHLPVSIPYWLRRMSRGESLHGDSRFSSAKLVATGFTFPLGLDGAIERICYSWRSRER